MERMVFVTGFARGGTSWLRDCIGTHPDIVTLPRERVVFRDQKDPAVIRHYFEVETGSLSTEARFIVNKAPANAPHLGFGARAFPESKFIFIIRDPRDVLVSHQRGTQQWMKGANSTVEGCMQKIESYFKGWLDAKDLPNVCLVRYEDLHQDFFVTMERVFRFIGVSHSPEILQTIYDTNNFQAQTNRSNVEDRAAARRKGVIGEWATQLTEKEQQWYTKSRFFSDFMTAHDYGWTLNTYENIVRAMSEAGVNFLSEDHLIRCRLSADQINIVVQHDIDYLTKNWCFDSVRETAAIDQRYGVPSAFNILPSDDKRYLPYGLSGVLSLVKSILTENERGYIGLHVNACERFYPPDVPNQPGDDFPHRNEIAAYIDQMVDDYRAAGVDFRLATSHGYSRGKKLPNNRDTPMIAEKLASKGITLFDVSIRPKLQESASRSCAITDVGGILKPRGFNNGYPLTDPRAYASLPKGCFLRFLTHPGNYPVKDPVTVIMRHFRG